MALQIVRLDKVQFVSKNVTHVHVHQTRNTALQWTEWGIVHMQMSIEIEIEWITITVFTAFSYLSYSNTTQAETPANITNPIAELRCVHRVKLGALHPESLSLVLWDSDCRGRLAWCRCWLWLRNCWFHHLRFGAAATHSYSTCWDDDDFQRNRWGRGSSPLDILIFRSVYS